MNIIVKILSILGMCATVAWFFWNPVGWTFQWEPLTAFLVSAVTFIGSEYAEFRELSSLRARLADPHPNDITLFREFIQLLPSKDVVDFLKEHDFLLEYDREWVRPVVKFRREWDNAEHEFQSPELEQWRKALLAAAAEFDNNITAYCAPNSRDRMAVVVDRLRDDVIHEKRFRKEADIINASAAAFVKMHQDFVRAGQKILRTDLRQIVNN